MMKKIYSFLVAVMLSIILLPAAPSMGLVFSGANTSFIDLGSTATAPAQFTVEAWVYYQSFPSGESAYILSSEEDNAGSKGFSLRTNTNKINLCIGNGGWVNVVGATALTANTWYHIATTCSATQIKVYVNGVLDGTTTLSTPMAISAKNLRIGDSPSWTGRMFNGIMADLRFWNIERTAAQIQANMSASLTGTETGLIANWKMNEGTGTAVADVKATYPITRPADVNWYYPVTGIAISGTTNYISALAGTTQMVATVSPAVAIQSVTWNVSDQSVASINATGLLTAKKNGTVTVTATSKDGSNITSNSIQVTVSNQPNIAPTKQILIDFGPNDVTNGNQTTSPDANGNYWTNALNEANGTVFPLLDKANGQQTGFNLVVGTGMSKNGIQNGGLLAPNASYLGEFAIATATQDYFFGTSGTLKFTGLNPAKGYKFKIFGSRDNAEVRISQFVFTGANTMTGTLQTSGTNVGGAGVNRNVSNIFSSDIIYPASNGEVSIAVTKTTGSFFHINAMKMEEYSNEAVAVTGITVTGNDITTTGTASQMMADISPANATVPSVTWAVSDPTIATIDENGLLRPLSDGTVTVTATTKEAGSTISGSKQITISNQYLSLYLSGTATENGNNVATAIPMKLVTNLQGNSTGVFELYTNLNAAGTFNFYSSRSGNAVVYGAGASAGTISAAGAAIDPSEVGPALITVDMMAKTYTILPVTQMGVAGAAGEAALVYKGQGVWSGLVNMANVLTDANKNFSFRANSNATYAIKRVKGTTTNAVLMESQATASNIGVEEIGLIDKGSYTVVLDMNLYTYSAIDSMKITVMGSSVPSGAGATNNQGYIYMYTQQLKQSYANNKGANWNVVNKSIGGNSTVDVLGRVDRDLFPQYGRYVIYALSLGNEGIHGSTNQQGVFDQWKNNMLTLISKARAKGLVPVVINNYTRDDFNASDYSYIKKIDMLIHEWDVPSINVLGAIDDGTGRWASGYMADNAHPNDAGHAEFSYAMVPSLFDALKANKPVPVKATGNYMAFDNSSTVEQLVYTPDYTVHPFTVSFDIKTTGNGVIASFKQGQVNGLLKIDAATGAIVYQSPNTGAAQIKGTVAVNDGQWHKITLSHFYARGETGLYYDNTLAGKLTEKLVPTVFKLNDATAPAAISYRDLFFYRAGMNADEVAGLSAGKMLKSSLELYAPLDGQAATTAGQLNNLAQSTTTLSKVSLSSTGIKVPAQFSAVKVYPNPAKSQLAIEGLNPAKQYECAVFTMDGKMAFRQAMRAGEALDVATLASAQYVLVLKDKSSAEQVALSITKR